VVARSFKPQHPPDGTVCADRRPHHRIGPAAAWPAEEAVGCRTGVPGGGPGAAGRPVGASLAAAVLRAAGPPVSLPAAAAGLPQAGEGGSAADLQGHDVSGQLVPVAGQRSAAAGCDPGAVRHLAGDGPAVGAGRVGELRLLRLPFPLVLGAEAVPDQHPRGNAGAWCLADPKLGEREVAAELLGHARDTGALREKMIVLADKGLAGREMEHYAADQIHVLLARPDRKDERRRFGNLAGMRQWIEAIFDTLKDQLSLERHGGRTPAGVFTRIAQRLLALAAAIWHNWQIGAPDKRSLIAYDH